MAAVELVRWEWWSDNSDTYCRVLEFGVENVVKNMKLLLI